MMSLSKSKSSTYEKQQYSSNIGKQAPKVTNKQGVQNVVLERLDTNFSGQMMECHNSNRVGVDDQPTPIFIND